MSKPFSSLIPSIESRLSGWETIKTRLAQPSEPPRRPSITLSRTFGCEGFPLAERLSVRLEQATGEAWTVFDKTLAESVARESGLPLRLLENLGDVSQKLEVLGIQRAGKPTHDEAFEKMAQMLIRVAQTGNAVLVGRGGAVLCQSLPNCFHFRLDAPLEFRIASIMKRSGRGQAEAESFVADGEGLREAFLEERLGTRMEHPCHYHGVFNNALQPVEVIAESILAFVRAAWNGADLFRK